MTAELHAALLLLDAIEPLAEELNRLIEPLPRRDPACREEAAWNLHSLSGGLVGTVGRMRYWAGEALKEAGG